MKTFELEKEIINLINTCGLTIDEIHYVFKSLYREIEDLYENYINSYNQNAEGAAQSTESETKELEDAAAADKKEGEE